MRLRVLTWNLMHGRSVPGAGVDLFDAFAQALAGWEWDVALLQEVPPWWPAQLVRRLRCEQRSVLTSRNGLLALRRFVAVRRPDLIKSNGGGANAVLTRSDRICDHRAVRLCRWPERRWAHGVRLASGPWLVNLHATAHRTERAQADVARAAAAARAWAGELPLVLGGDLNLRAAEVDAMRAAAASAAGSGSVDAMRAAAGSGSVDAMRAAAGSGSVGAMRSVADSDVDHVLIDSSWAPVGGAAVLDSGTLSDHAPLAVTLDSDPA